MVSNKVMENMGIQIESYLAESCLLELKVCSWPKSAVFLDKYFFYGNLYRLGIDSNLKVNRIELSWVKFMNEAHLC